MGFAQNRLRSVHVWGLIFLFLMGCNPSGLDALRPGDALLEPTRPSDARRLAIARGDAWATELELASPKAEMPFRWKIARAPGGLPLPDARADGAMVAHVLDALGTLKLAELPQEMSLESAGLSPPRFAIRWSSGAGAGEIHLGKAGPARGQVFALVPRISAKRPVLVSGALLRVLEEITEFSRLRQRAWSETGPDDFNEVEIHLGGKKVLHAQRERGRWVDLRERPIARDVDALLERLIAAPIREYLDDESRAAAVSERLSRAPDALAIFTDRQGVSVRLSLARDGALALDSRRPKAPFTLDATVFEELK